MKVLLAAALLLTSILAGCSSGGEDGLAADVSLAAPVLFLNVTVGDQTHRYTSAPAAAGTPSASASATVTVSSTASATGSGNATAGNGTKASAASGEAPLNVSVTLGASGLPAAFTWALDFGDAAAGSAGGNATGNATSNGTKGSGPLPATVAHTYTEAGNHTLRFTLTPANGTSIDVRATVQVAAGNATGNGTGAALPPGSDLGTSTLDQEGELLLGTYQPEGAEPVCGGGVEGTATFDWAINATGPDGVTPAAVASFLVTLTPDDPSGAQDADLFLLGPDGAEVGSGTGLTATESIAVSKGYPAGTYQIVVLGCTSIDLPFTVHGEAKLVAA